MKKLIDINSLMVNPENYRFDPVDNQSEAIDLMLEEKGEEIVNLATHIFKNGLDLAKDSRVREVKKGLFLILDGNRRATAIKCLGDLSIVKDGFLKNKFTKILKETGSVPKEVNCFVYETEKEASEWIRLDHTGKNQGVGQDDWEAAAKDRFDYKFGGKLSPAMQVINLYQHETKNKLNTKDLKISTINRILANPESRSYLGVDIRNGQLTLVASKTEALARLDKLFNKIIVDDVAVKEVYHVPDSIKFMKALFGDQPKPAAKASAVSPQGAVQNSGKVKRVVPKTGGRNSLIPRDCVLRIHEPKINNIYHELRNVPLDGTTNAIGVLFRVFIEISLDYFANKVGINFKNDTKLGGKITIVTDYLEKKGIAAGSQLGDIRSVTNKGNSILSINKFHEYVHSFKTQPIPIDLIYKWDNLQEFFEILWGVLDVRKGKRK